MGMIKQSRETSRISDTSSPTKFVLPPAASNPVGLLSEAKGLVRCSSYNALIKKRNSFEYLSVCQESAAESSLNIASMTKSNDVHPSATNEITASQLRRRDQKANEKSAKKTVALQPRKGERYWSEEEH